MKTPIPDIQPTITPHPPLRVSDLRQWVYCPRVAWFTLVCPVPKRESYKMQLGRQKEQHLARLLRRRTLRAFGLEAGDMETGVQLYSPQLGLSGKLDVMIRQGRYRYPVEVKFTRGEARLNHRIQLAGYALLLESELGIVVPHGYVLRLPDDKVERIELTERLRETVISLLRAIRDMIYHERTPPASPVTACCVDCEYRNFCGDV